MPSRNEEENYPGNRGENSYAEVDAPNDSPSFARFIHRYLTSCSAVACAMAATAGALLSPQLTLSPAMGRAPLILSLAMAAAGGPDRLWGTLVASFVVDREDVVVQPRSGRQPA